MKVQASADLGKITDDAEFRRFAAIVVADLARVINGRLEFGDNILSNTLQMTFPAAGVDVQVSHSLGRAPQGYFLIRSNVAMVIYDGSSPATSAHITLRASSAGQATVILI